LSVSVWAKNITDEEYAVRGFYFANNPGNGYVDELYIQKGVPRTFGVTITYDF
jgi:outer membrane receptor protein involved in Fe transport